MNEPELQEAGNPIASLQSNLIQEGRAVSEDSMANHFYTEPGCAACRAARKFLVSHNVPFEERNVRSNPDYLRILTEELDSLTTPTLVWGDKIIVGFDRREYELLLGPFRPKRETPPVRTRV